jgi:L-ascorbate metabolism protein UlaG (beta-lactamase superfamily)
MEITYLGHSTFLIELKGRKILLDPFISPNELARHIDVDSVQADYILLSHGHQDHVADVERIVKRTGATVVSSFEVVSWFSKKGLEKTHPMNIGGKWHFDFGTVVMVQAIHSNSMPDGSYGGSAAGFVIQSEDKTLYYAGDTALFSDMKLIGELYKPTFAFLPIGDNFTMDIDAALKAAEFVGVTTIIGMHYDTFPYIKIDHKAAISKSKNQGKDLKLLEIGKSITI